MAINTSAVARQGVGFVAISLATLGWITPVGVDSLGTDPARDCVAAEQLVCAAVEAAQTCRGVVSVAPATEAASGAETVTGALTAAAVATDSGSGADLVTGALVACSGAVTGGTSSVAALADGDTGTSVVTGAEAGSGTTTATVSAKQRTEGNTNG